MSGFCVASLWVILRAGILFLIPTPLRNELSVNTLCCSLLYIYMRDIGVSYHFYHLPFAFCPPEWFWDAGYAFCPFPPFLLCIDTHHSSCDTIDFYRGPDWDPVPHLSHPLSFRSPVDITLSAIPSRSVATMRLSLSPLHDCTLPEPAPSFFPFPHAGSYTSPLCPCALSCCFICGISFVFLAVTGPMHAVRSEFCGLGPRRIAKEGSIDSD